MNYRISFMVGISDNAQTNMEQLAHRYSTILIRLFNDIILKRFTDAAIVGLDVVPLQYRQGDTETDGTMLFQAPTIVIEVPVVF